MFKAIFHPAFVTPKGRVLSGSDLETCQLIAAGMYDQKFPECRRILFADEYQLEHSACVVSPKYDPDWQAYWKGKAR